MEVGLGIPTEIQTHSVQYSQSFPFTAMQPF